MAACFPSDKEVKKKSWECHPNPEIRLGQQPKPQRFSKSQVDYENDSQNCSLAGQPLLRSCPRQQGSRVISPPPQGRCQPHRSAAHAH